MLDDVSSPRQNQEVIQKMNWKPLRPGVQIGHFASVNPASGFGPAQIYVKRFEAREPSSQTKTLFLLHDLCQHHGRFVQMIETLRPQLPHVNFIAMDFVGHGLSSGTRGQFEAFEVLVQDFHNLLNLLQKNEKEQWIVLGHGMGGMVSLDLINRFYESAGHRIDGLILSNFILKFQSLFLQMEESLPDEIGLLKKILFKTRPGRFFTGQELLSDPLDILTYEQDPLVIHRPTLNVIKELHKKTQTIYQDSYFIDRPLLLLKSEFGNALSTEGMDYFAKGIKKELLTEKKYSLMKHDLYNERNKEIVYQDILNWIKNDEA